MAEGFVCRPEIKVEQRRLVAVDDLAEERSRSSSPSRDGAMPSAVLIREGRVFSPVTFTLGP